MTLTDFPIQPGAAISLGNNTTLVACALCRAPAQPFARLFHGRRISSMGQALPISSTALPNEPERLSDEQRVANFAALESFQQHYMAHPGHHYLVSQGHSYLRQDTITLLSMSSGQPGSPERGARL